MSVLSECNPKNVFHFFEEICNIPHGSGNTKQISDYLVKFAEDRNLKYIQDEMNNVIIFKPGTEGYEASEPIMIQGHVDMVCEKRQDVEHDFTKDGLRLIVEDGYVRADGTTLGGDDGIAVAYALAILDSNELKHPPLEVILTVDEEIGLLGADGIDCSVLKGHKLLNLDSEEEGILLVSCAGGLSGNCSIPMRRVTGEGQKLTIKVHGLLGGHSGAEIDKMHANALKLMGRLLYGLSRELPFAVVSLEGGNKDNAIPREAIAEVLISAEDTDDFLAYLKSEEEHLRKEYEGSDPDITIRGVCGENEEVKVLHPTSQEMLLFFLQNLPNGIRKMSGTIDHLVETSSNIGIFRLTEEELYAVCSVRSSIVSARDALSREIEYLTEFLGGSYLVQGAYPAWEYRAQSPLRDTMVSVYEEVYGEKPAVNAIHAGLECGLFYEKIEDLDCVSFGPDIVDIHTSEEKMNIASVERVWKYLIKVLEALK